MVVKNMISIKMEVSGKFPRLNRKIDFTQKTFTKRLCADLNIYKFWRIMISGLRLIAYRYWSGQRVGPSQRNAMGATCEMAINKNICGWVHIPLQSEIGMGNGLWYSGTLQ